MTAPTYPAIVAPQFTSGVYSYADLPNSDAPYGDRTAADKAAQVVALRRVLSKLGKGTSPSYVVALVADELGVEL